MYPLYNAETSGDIPNAKPSANLETVRDSANPDTFLMQVTLPSMTAPFGAFITSRSLRWLR